MPLFQSSDLQRFYFQGENEVSSEKPFLVDRVSLATVAGTIPAIFTLPDYCVSIRRVTYQAQMLDPLPQRNLREVFQSATQTGKPFWYIYNNVGQNQIQLFPAPGDNLSVLANVWGSDIPNALIVEFYRATDNQTFTIPTYLRRQLLKQYVAMRANQIDGPGYNAKLAKYFGQKWQMKKGEFAEWLDYLYNAPRKLGVNEVIGSNYFPGEPVLPIAQFGISVDEGE